MSSHTHTLHTNATALDAVVSALKTSEQRRRTEDAIQMQHLARAVELTALETPLVLENGVLVPSNQQATLAYRALRAELACALRVSEQTIERRMSQAYELRHHYFSTFLTLREGLLGAAHAEVIVTAGRIIGDQAEDANNVRRSAYEAAVLEHAVRETPGRLRPIARRLAEQYAERTIDERHIEACRARRVWVVDREDGMSDLTAYLPSVEAHAIYDRLTRASRELALAEQQLATAEFDETGTEAREGADAETNAAAGKNTETSTRADADEPFTRRTRDQLRSDLFSSLLQADIADATSSEAAGTAGHTSTLNNMQAHVQIFITDEAFWAEQLRLNDTDLDWGAPTGLAPAELAGSGPIDTLTARDLAATATHWQLVRQEPESGAVISVDRYRPSEQMRRILRARDLHCRFPGCRAPVHRCDIDHTIDAAKGGATSTVNLAHLCRSHHTLKHHGGWRVSQSRDGDLTWRSPTGRSYTDRPPSRVRFERTKNKAKNSSLAEGLPAEQDAGIFARPPEDQLPTVTDLAPY